MASLPSLVTAGRERSNIGGIAAFHPSQLLHKLALSVSKRLLPPVHSYGLSLSLFSSGVVHS
jgi:hypothetical protein